MKAAIEIRDNIMCFITLFLSADQNLQVAAQKQRESVSGLLPRVSRSQYHERGSCVIVEP